MPMNVTSAKTQILDSLAMIYVIIQYNLGPTKQKCLAYHHEIVRLPWDKSY